MVVNCTLKQIQGNNQTLTKIACYKSTNLITLDYLIYY